jgi:hypothetical protein
MNVWNELRIAIQSNKSISLQKYIGSLNLGILVDIYSMWINNKVWVIYDIGVKLVRKLYCAPNLNVAAKYLNYSAILHVSDIDWSISGGVHAENLDCRQVEEGMLWNLSLSDLESHWGKWTLIADRNVVVHHELID